MLRPNGDGLVYTGLCPLVFETCGLQLIRQSVWHKSHLPLRPLQRLVYAHIFSKANLFSLYGQMLCLSTCLNPFRPRNGETKAKYKIAWQTNVFNHQVSLPWFCIQNIIASKIIIIIINQRARHFVFALLKKDVCIGKLQRGTMAIFALRKLD